MKQHRLSYYGFIGWILMAITSCSKVDLEQEATSADIDETFTRADLVKYTINVEKAGTLDSLVEAGNYANAQKLIVTGNIGYEDVNYVDVNMSTVEVLDLSAATYESEYIEGDFLSNSTKIKEISLPGNITSISGGWRINNHVTSGYILPFKCSSLISINMPEGMTSIGEYAFDSCSSLTSINIPESVTSIGYCAFHGCSSLTSITIPKSVTSIGNGAFWDCSSLTSINIPEGVTSIESWAFHGCSSLTSINIPEGVTSIGAVAFSGCTSLTSINIPKGMTSIEGEAFRDCSSLTSINIPEGVTSIGSDAFYGCSSLTGINIPEGVTSIGWGAFCGCSSLTSINIPKGMTSIEGEVFSSCSSLTSINIPEGVTSIGSRAFSYCSSLTSINIPEDVTSIEDEAFIGCSSLQKVICNSSGNISDLSSSSNPYCWLIINRTDDNLPMYGPNWQYVVINGVAQSVTLPYQRTVDFTIPEEVESIKKISYSMNFEANYSSSSYGIWRTIALPFTPTYITNAEKETLAPFDSEVDGAKNFWLKEWTTDGFKDVTIIEPNHPYLIAMPYSNEYDDKYNISGKVTFSAENLTIEELGNNTPLTAEGTYYTMYASFSYMDKTDGVYVLNNDNEFVNNSSPVYPYEAYLKTNTATLRSVISLNQGRAATRAESEGKRKPQIDDM